MTNDPMHTCSRCHTVYLERKSTSTLRYTYCNALCELNDLRLVIKDFIRTELQRAPSVTVEV